MFITDNQGFVNSQSSADLDVIGFCVGNLTHSVVLLSRVKAESVIIFLYFWVYCCTSLRFFMTHVTGHDGLLKNCYIFIIIYFINYYYVLFLFSAPFTIQRLCELMMEPRKNYSNSEKFMRGVEKVRASLNPCYYQQENICYLLNKSQEICFSKEL